MLYELLNGLDLSVEDLALIAIALAGEAVAPNGVFVQTDISDRFPQVADVVFSLEFSAAVDAIALIGRMMQQKLA